MIRQTALPLKDWIEEQLYFLGGITLLMRDCIREGFKRPFYGNLLVEQIYQIGVRSFPLILVTSGTIGMVMALQFGFGLEKFGGKPYVPRLVASTIFREIGPMFTSLMLAARVGAGMASEIGSMVVTQQIDAIRALGTSPIKKIVLPRILACLIILPLLAAMANVIGNAGGWLIGVSELGLDPQFYYRRILDTANIRDYLSGFGKTFFFALFIAVPSCYFGLNVKNGTQEVGMATRKAVVTSSLLILLGDFFLAKLFWILEKWL
ncbi:MlaE family ABC transporter permease [Pseudobdellovibrio exovorus]|uniref:ABC transporter, permease protein n=1 Tax=Pseudobdellovibrio exovorus JSS TaxID=1184267 RepID=M4VT35_9BACT|nr:ABC transporter permease [Pseudobdellovibrio exovorus]AGH96369.1 ABC transporter, permease protein [Pseudobdellovibrio exovorus JSS]